MIMIKQQAGYHHDDLHLDDQVSLMLRRLLVFIMIRRLLVFIVIMIRLVVIMMIKGHSLLLSPGEHHHRDQAVSLYHDNDEVGHHHDDDLHLDDQVHLCCKSIGVGQSC